MIHGLRRVIPRAPPLKASYGGTLYGNGTEGGEVVFAGSVEGLRGSAAMPDTATSVCRPTAQR